MILYSAVSRRGPGTSCQIKLKAHYINWWMPKVLWLARSRRSITVVGSSPTKASRGALPCDAPSRMLDWPQLHQHLGVRWAGKPGNLCGPDSSKFKGQKWQETTVCRFFLRRAEQREVPGTLRWKGQDRWAGVMHETERIWWARHFTTCLWEAAHLLKMANHIHHPHTWHQRRGSGRNGSLLFFRIGMSGWRLVL